MSRQSLTVGQLIEELLRLPPDLPVEFRLGFDADGEELLLQGYYEAPSIAPRPYNAPADWEPGPAYRFTLEEHHKDPEWMQL